MHPLLLCCYTVWQLTIEVTKARRGWCTCNLRNGRKIAVLSFWRRCLASSRCYTGFSGGSHLQVCQIYTGWNLHERTHDDYTREGSLWISQMTQQLLHTEHTDPPQLYSVFHWQRSVYLHSLHKLFDKLLLLVGFRKRASCEQKA